MGLQRREPGNYFHDSDPGEASAGNCQRISVTDQEAELLAAAVTAKDIVLEIGTGLGVSTRALASAAEFVHTIDPDPWVYETIVPDLPENVRHWKSLRDFIQTWKQDGSPRISLVFVDGSHDSVSVTSDTFAALELDPDEIWWHDGYMFSVREGIERTGLQPEVVLVDGKETQTSILRWVRSNA